VAAVARDEKEMPQLNAAAVAVAAQAQSLMLLPQPIS
jgi:hypothetical protein